MSDHTGCLTALNGGRTASLISPREHGAWGLLLVPLITGGAVGLLAGGNPLPLVPLTVAALSLFWLRTPLESWLGIGPIRPQTQHERRIVGFAVLILGKITAAALVALFWTGHNHALLLLGAAAIAAFILQSLLRKLGRRTRMLSQIVGTLGLTVTAPAAYYVAAGQLDRTAWALWLANFLFAGNQIHFVQLRIRSARLEGLAEKSSRGRSFLLGEVLLALALIGACRLHLLPAVAALAFLPLLIRGAAWFFESQKRLVVRRLGWTELAHAIVFGILLVSGFFWGR